MILQKMVPFHCRKSEQIFLGTWFSFARKFPDVAVDVIASDHRIHSNFNSHSYFRSGANRNLGVVTVLMQLSPLVGVVSPQSLARK